MSPPATVVILAQRAPVRCAVCHDELMGPSEVCERCHTAAHPDCRAALARCPTLACGLALGVALRPPLPPGSVRVRARPLGWYSDARPLWDRSLTTCVVILVLVGLLVVSGVTALRDEPQNVFSRATRGGIDADITRQIK